MKIVIDHIHIYKAHSFDVLLCVGLAQGGLVDPHRILVLHPDRYAKSQAVNILTIANRFL